MILPGQFLRSSHLTGGRRPYIIAIPNQNGGVGKTTTAITVCPSRGPRALVVDVDTYHFGIDPEASRRNAYHALNKLATGLRSVILNLRPNLDLVPASLDVTALSVVVNRDRRLHKHLSVVQASYDYVLIDWPGWAGHSQSTSCKQP